MKESISTKILENNYLAVKDFLGCIPSIDKMAKNSIYPVSSYLKHYGTWYNFLKKMNDITSIEKNFSIIILDFFQLLEETKMTKSYKMGLFLIFFNRNTLLKQVYSLEEIAKNFKELYSTFPFKLDLQDKKFENLESWQIKEYKNLILSNPIYFLTKDDKNSDFFIFKNNSFILTDSLYSQLKNNDFILQEISNRIYYRLFHYFKEKYNILYEY